MNMKSKWWGWRGVGILLVVIASGFTPSARAQSSTTGALNGTVTDPSGAVVPGATVTLTNNATGQSQGTTTGSNGGYTFPLLTPGSYSVRIEASGFKAYVASSVTVNVTETPFLGTKLEIGQSTQVVTITGEAPVLQTQDATVGTLVDSQTITAIPLTTRNFTQVVTLSPGVETAVNNAANMGKGNQDMYVNGNAIGSNTYQIDGLVANNWASALTIDSTNNVAAGLAVPNPDAVAEFKVQTGQYDATYGRNPGANVNLVTKSGSNEFHGDVYEFIRNDIFNANDPFHEAAGQPRPTMKQNQFGATFGGPIIKDKLFFFGSYQGTRQLDGYDQTALSTQILPALTNDRSAATLGAEYCPANQPNATLQKDYYTSAGGSTGAGVQVACDGSNINPVALAILQGKFATGPEAGQYFLPTPQTIIPATASTPALGFSSFSIPAQFTEDQFDINTDYVITSKHTFSERLFISRYPETQQMSNTAGGNLGTTPGSPSVLLLGNYNPTLKLSSVLSNTLVNEAIVGGVYFATSAVGQNYPTATSLGMTPPTPFWNVMIPVNIGGSLGTWTGVGGTGEDWQNHTLTLALSDQLSWIHGRQTLHFGGDFSHNYWHLLATGRARGGPSGINNFTDFLIGESAAQNGSPGGVSNINTFSDTFGAYAMGASARDAIARFGDVFVQDDIKVNSRLTMNVGLRWEYIEAPFDGNGDLGVVWANLAAMVPIPPPGGTNIGTTVPANYNPARINPYTNQPFGLPSDVFVRPGNSMFQNSTPLDDFAPRIGFAWQPLGSQSRLVVRGGYGWFYETQGAGGIVNNSNSNDPTNERFSLSGVTNATATLQTMAPPVTLGFIPRVVPTATSILLNHAAVGKLVNGVVQEYSLGTQYQLTPSLALEVGFVGSRSTHNPMNIQLNQGELASATNPVDCGLPSTVPGVNANGCITTSTASNVRWRVPIVGETPTSETVFDYSGNTWYNSLQTILRKQFSHGLTFQASYTYSHGLSDWLASSNGYPAGRVDNTTAPPHEYNWGPFDFDRTHRLVVNYSYHLPAPFHDSLSSKFLGGWSLSGVTIAQVGTPLNLVNSASSTATAYGLAQASTISLCPGFTYANLVTPGNDTARTTNWINTAAVCAPSLIPGTTVTDYGDTRREQMRGPGQFNWDMSLGKATKVGGIREDATLEFRAEFYNAFNHSQYANPGVTANSTSTFGKITATSVAPRLIQFGLKYLF
jgi:hypothetical protein